MGRTYEVIDDRLEAWIAAQPMWFVATAPLAADGRINVSPRSGALVVLGPLRVGWADLTGSGVETIAHLQENGRICVMWASFDLQPRLVRLHGQGRVARPGSAEFDEVVGRRPLHPSTRAVIVVDVERISDSCGHGVPVMDVVDERDLLRRSAERRGPDGLAAYRAEKNALSIDGLPGL